MRIKNLILAVGFMASFVLLAFASSPVFAIESESEQNDTPKTSAVSQNATLENKKLEAQKKLEEAKLNAQKKLEEAKLNIKAKTEAERQKICQEKESQITEKINKKTADATKHKATFDKIFTRVKEFKVKNNLNPTNYDNLVASVDNNAKNAQAAIDALKSIDPKVDCTQIDAAKTKIATYVDALKQTREALKSYRTAIKDLLVAVKNSASEAVKTEAQNNVQTTTNSGGSN